MADPTGTSTATLLACRGCCCGTAEKHPGVDHDGQIERLMVAVTRLAGARLRITDCLGPCAQSNVIAVRHRDTATPGVRVGTTWFGDLLETADTDALATWVASGANPNMLPARLIARRFEPGETPVTPDHEISFLDRRRDHVGVDVDA